MPTTPAKPLSPAELAKLEHAFATEPAGDAYKPLAEAYLAMGRFMEAMVVCKKGVKAHPQAVEPRLLLSRVYSDQGKDKKAIEELNAALAVAPTDKKLLRALAHLQLKGGEREAGAANLLKAYELDPQDADTAELFSEHEIDFPRPAAPARAQSMASKAPLRQVQPGSEGVPVRSEAVSGPPVRARRNGGRAAQGYVPPPSPPPMLEESDPHAATAAAASAHKARHSRIFIMLLLALPIVVGGYFLIGQWRSKRRNEFNRQLISAREQLKRDNWDSYKRARASATRALEINPDSTEAHAYMAYAYAIEWGEHGGGDAARKEAERHLERALKGGGEDSSLLISAEALIKTYGGRGAAAQNELQEKIRALDAEKKRSSQLYLTLGIIQMSGGDLDRARENLEQAQQLAASDPRIYAALGNVNRRLGLDSQASKYFDSALRYEKDHPESLLGKSLILTAQSDYELYPRAAKMLQKLLDADPPPSPRQLAMAHLVRSLLISQVSSALPLLRPDIQKPLSEGTSVPIDRARAQAEVLRSEEAGFALDRQNPELHLIKGERLLAEGNVEGATAEMRMAVRMDPSRAQFHVELARALMKRPGGEREARDAILSALKGAPDSPRLLVLLGDAHRKMGSIDEAIAAYEKSIAAAGAKNPDAKTALGAIYRERKDFAKAQELLDKAAQESLGQASKLAAAKIELAQLLEAKNERSKAEEVYAQALTVAPDYAPAYFFYARALAASGKDVKARATAQEYLKRDPKGEYAADAQRLLGQ
jgi:tetratricopeptide (TPR) repeat protein